MQKAILYARTATAEIVDPAYAIENQIKAMRSYCNENNIGIANTYHDVIGGIHLTSQAFKCETCGQYLRAYKAKNKQYYYKCNTNGCCCNKRADELHKTFKAMLDQYTLNIENEGIRYVPADHSDLPSTYRRRGTATVKH